MYSHKGSGLLPPNTFLPALDPVVTGQGFT
jgi:hypothetical protein